MKSFIEALHLGPWALIFLGGILSLIGTVWAAREQIAQEKESRLRAEETLANIQGDHSLEIAHKFETSNGVEILTIFVRNLSDLPTYGLTSRIIDVEAYGFEFIQKMEDIVKQPSPIYEKYFNEITPKSLGQILSLKLDPKKQQHTFKIYFSSRKGKSETLIRFQKIKSDWFKETLPIIRDSKNQ